MLSKQGSEKLVGISGIIGVTSLASVDGDVTEHQLFYCGCYTFNFGYFFSLRLFSLPRERLSNLSLGENLFGSQYS